MRNKFYLFFGERSAGGCHHIRDASLMHGYDIGITFHHIGHILSHNLFLGKGYGVKNIAFVVNLRFGRIDVFGLRFVARQDTPAKAQHPSRKAVYGKDHTSAKTVVEFSTVFFLNGESALNQIFFVITAFERRLCKAIPAFRTIAQLELLDDGIGKTSFPKIRKPDTAAFFCFPKILHKMVGGVLGYMVKRFTLRLTLNILRGKFLFLYLDIVLTGKKTQGFHVFQMLVFHDETHRITTFSATEAFKDTLSRRNNERRGLFLMERTQTQIIRTPLL